MPEEEYEEDLDHNAKLLKQLNNKQGTDIYEAYEETFAEYNDEYEDDEDYEDSHYHLHCNQLKNNHHIGNSKIKTSSSASPIVNGTFQSVDIRINKDKRNFEKIHTNSQIPSISFDESTGITHDQSLDDNDESLAFSSSSQKNDHCETPSVNFYSKFLTANNLMTERGGLVNIRTGSFNLGCQQDQLSDELTDSYEFFNSLQNSADQSTFTKSSSNYSFTTK